MLIDLLNIYFNELTSDMHVIEARMDDAKKDESVIQQFDKNCTNCIRH